MAGICSNTVHTRTRIRAVGNKDNNAQACDLETVEWKRFAASEDVDNEEAIGFKLLGATPPATRELAAQHSRGCGPRLASPTLRQREVEDRRLSNTRTVEGS